VDDSDLQCDEQSHVEYSFVAGEVMPDYGLNIIGNTNVMESCCERPVDRVVEMNEEHKGIDCTGMSGRRNTSHPRGGGGISKKIRKKRETHRTKKAAGHSSNVSMGREYYAHRSTDMQEFKRYNNNVDLLQAKIEVAEIQLSIVDDPIEVSHVKKQIVRLQQQLKGANGVIDRRQAKLRSTITAREKGTSVQSNVNIKNSVADENLQLTNEWFTLTAAKFIESAKTSLFVGPCVWSNDKEAELNLEVENKLVHLLKSRKAAGPLLNNAMHKLQCVRESIHLKIQMSTDVNTEDEKNAFCVREYGKLKCHYRHQELYTVKLML
jgi:hypothetical protein